MSASGTYWWSVRSEVFSAKLVGAGQTIGFVAGAKSPSLDKASAACKVGPSWGSC